MKNKILEKRFSKTALTALTAAVMLTTGQSAHAISSGTDLNLSMHGAAGGMAGAAYTRVNEASAAVFGNPATLTQLKGANFNIGAALIKLDVENTQSFNNTAAGLSFQNQSTSEADDYIIPTIGVALEITPKLTLGVGLEADAGLGADYRTDPIALAGGLGGGAALGGNFNIPLVVEVISLNANIAAGYKVSNDLSLGGSITIGFGLGQLGTAGPTGNLDTLCSVVLAGPPGTCPIYSDFGGTTSSVHDIAIGASFGATYQATQGMTLSGTIKSPVKYSFENILYQDPALFGGNGWQTLDVEQPLEIIAGIAFDGLMPGLLVEADVAWKNWGDAAAYEDAWDDQILFMLGAQQKIGDWSFRAGYSFAEDILKDTPNSTLGGLTGLGSVPLGTGTAACGPLAATCAAAATDIIGLVQTSLLPVIWEHTVTLGAGYNFTPNVRLDGFAAVAFSNDVTRDAPTVGVLVDSTGLLPAGSEVSYRQDIGEEIAVGLSLNISM